MFPVIFRQNHPGLRLVTSPVGVIVPSAVGLAFFDEHQWVEGKEHFSNVREGILATDTHYGSLLRRTMAK